MLILSRGKKLVVNMDQVSAFYIDEDHPGIICADVAGIELRYVLGQYASPARAEIVIQMILDAVKNVQELYKMPPDNDELDDTQGAVHQHCEYCFRHKSNTCPYRWQYRPDNCAENEVPF